eukprot:CAMPEP_0173394374 /NCGR_PEP_ID=MMETSP1356-20130122/27188_1 /TAXON_ID=77927 ORGANISM="Hemiselmis virescens, Strain PCC157" /NCGR_SAMPLE_ID=MMETSP1356 /ASSEMBLY_ACC=CAM_ASM_000847 /LENGTH=138 /DNA_ID=CAMNT_0014352717 /DNA_START=79 /DNA_END=495 /DNA_ORIENTATION=-
MTQSSSSFLQVATGTRVEAPALAALSLTRKSSMDMSSDRSFKFSALISAFRSEVLVLCMIIPSSSTTAIPLMPFCRMMSKALYALESNLTDMTGLVMMKRDFMGILSTASQITLKSMPCVTTFAIPPAAFSPPVMPTM